jgi:aryl-alcohol dehydrogenase
MEIQAAVTREKKGEFKIEEISLDTTLRPNELLVKVVATGLCHTDLTIRDGLMVPFPLPAVLGHEGSGIVVQVGSAVTKVATGDHVVLAPSSCGKCEQCISGHPSYCPNIFQLSFSGRRADGSCPYHDHSGSDVSGLFFGQSSFANYSLTREENVVKVSKEVPLEILGPLGCGLQTGAGSVLNLLKAGAGDSIVIFGVGSVGLAGLMAAKAAGCTTIVAVDIHDSRLDLAKQLGATHTINSKTQKISETVLKEIMPGGLHYALDTTGRNDVITEALNSLRPLGHCVLVIVAGEKLEINGMSLLGKTISFGVEGDSMPDIFIPRLIDLYQKGLFPFDKLIRFYDFEDINQAVEDSEKGTTIKAVVRMPA